MVSPIKQLQKVRGKGARELAVRGRQEISKLSERVLGGGRFSDRQLLREISPGSRNGDGPGSAMLILGRMRAATASPSSPERIPLFGSLACRKEITSIIKRRFPDERAALLERAEKAIAGRFDLLGFRNLSFGDPIDWHLDPTSGKRGPLAHWSRIDYLDPSVAGDKKLIWELNRHGHFVTLGQAYWLTGDERFAEAFVGQASGWMDANPPKLGINWASSLELAFRSIAWLWALHLFADSDRLTAGFVSRLFKYLIAQGRHIERYLSSYFSPNTHLTGEALGLVYLGTALPELNRAGRWRELGLKILVEQLPIHIRPDGVYFEQSSYYQRYTADFYAQLIALAWGRGVGLPGETRARAMLAFDHLMWITRPDGTTPLYGDDDGGRLLTLAGRPPDDFRDTLAVGAALFGRGDWKYVAGEAPVELLWLLGPAALDRYDALEVQEPADTSRAFADGGYVVMRDGWSKQSSYVLIDCGPHGADGCGHSHADALAIEFAAGGKTWLVDSGTFTYTADAELRDAFRTTQAHNTVTVDGQPQSVPAGPFAWQHVAQSRASEFISDEMFDYFEGSHDGYARLDDPVTHRRSVLLVKGTDGPATLSVRDRFDARASHRYALRYHLAPDSRATAIDNGAAVTDENGNALLIRAFASSELKCRIEEGWVSRCYGSRQPAPVALFEAEGIGAQEFVSVCSGGPVWSPPFGAALPGVQAEATTEGRPHKGYLVSLGDARDTLLYSDAKDDFSCESVTARGCVAWARFIDGKFARGCLIRGDKFEVAESFAIRSQGTFRYCAVRQAAGRIEITIQDANQFDLSFSAPLERIVVNKTGFDLATSSRAARFVLAGSKWVLVSEG
jgi:hypothetical protein